MKSLIKFIIITLVSFHNIAFAGNWNTPASTTGNTGSTNLGSQSPISTATLSFDFDGGGVDCGSIASTSNVRAAFSGTCNRGSEAFKVQSSCSGECSGVFSYRIEGENDTSKYFTVSGSWKNLAPNVLSISSLTLVERSVNVVSKLNAYDKNGDTITYAIVGGEDASFLAIDSSSGAIRFKDIPFYDTPTDSDANNLYEIEVSYSDPDGLSNRSVISIEVLKDTDGDRVPDIQETLDNTNEENTLNYLDSDSDGVPDYLDLGGAGYFVDVYVNSAGVPIDSNFDGVNDYQDSVQIAPVIISSAITTVKQDALYNYSIIASDRNNDPLSWQENTVPSWLSFTSGVLQSNVVGNGVAPQNSGDGVNQSPDNSIASEARINARSTVFSSGKLYFTDMEEFGIRFVDENGKIQTFFQGNGDYLNLNPLGIAVNSLDNTIYVGDYGKGTIVRLNARGERTIVATLPTGDRFVLSLYLNTKDDFLYATTKGGIYRIDITNPSASLTRIVGTGVPGYSDSGNPLTSQVNEPEGIGFNSRGELIFVDGKNFAVRKVNMLSNSIETIAGQPTIGGSNGDGGPAINANLQEPVSLVLNSYDEIYILERQSRTVRKIGIDGNINTYHTVRNVGGFSDDLTIDTNDQLYILATNAIVQVAFQANLTGTPDINDIGIHDISLVLSDGVSPDVSYDFQVEVIGVDTDNDGVRDYIEVQQGTDPNNIHDVLDTDNDGIADHIETLAGSDPVNPMSLPIDTDNDGVPDVVELIQETDPAVANDFIDSDNDGVSDFEEGIRGSEPLDNTDALTAIDTDGDGVPDYIEIREGSNPTDVHSVIDTDKDGIADYIETLAGSNANDVTSFPSDVDNDGVPDVVEQIQGTDSSLNDNFRDSDNDGVSDFVEGIRGTNSLVPNDNNEALDSDGDGVPDYIEEREGTDPTDKTSVIDTDNDGIADYIETLAGSGISDPMSLPVDTDNDGVPDVVEQIQGTDPALVDSFIDSDSDGVSDFEESVRGTNPLDNTDALQAVDSDNDGVPDYIEIREGSDPADALSVIDTDNDGIADYIESLAGSDPINPMSFPADTDNDGVPDVVEQIQGTDPTLVDDFIDTDNDGVSDFEESVRGTNPSDNSDGLQAIDTDSDGVPDYIEVREGSNPTDASSVVDTDNDGIADYIETLAGSDPTNPMSFPADTDNDGVPDVVEQIQGTDPTLVDDFIDTDNDGVSDFEESVRGTNPSDNSDGLQAIDTDSDGVPDYIEVREGSNPTDASSVVDTDNDGIADYIETLAGSDPTNPMSLPNDTDNDGVPDVVEEIQGTDPALVDSFIDSDGDGVSDFEESVRGSDAQDNTDALQAVDTDGDGVPDYIEAREGSDPTDASSVIDTDKDGIADYVETLAGSDPTDPMNLPTDTDDDGVPDVVEEIQGTDPAISDDFIDSDGDGVSDFEESVRGSDAQDNTDALQAVDTDHDGVPDYIEVREGSDPTDALSGNDADNDGIADYIETLAGSDPTNPMSLPADTDNDGVPDVVEQIQGTDPESADDFIDSDSDGVSDFEEFIRGTDPLDNSDGLQAVDTDHDGVPDYIEIREGSDPTDALSVIDTDNDGIADYVETLAGSDPTNPMSLPTDTDNDGVPDVVEEIQGTDPALDDSFIDSDGDGVSDFEEFIRGTDPLDNTDALQAVDTDNDGVPDYIEIREGSDPTNALSVIDTDNDGIADYVESLAGSDPADPMSLPNDTDNDGVPDVVEEIQGTDPALVDNFIDSDGDGVSDFEEAVRGTDSSDENDGLQAVDTDGDGVPDYIEAREGSDPTDASSVVDTDNDGIADYVETLAGSDPTNPTSLPVDTDSDGVPDVVEEIQGTDPESGNDFNDRDNDGVSDFEEGVRGTNSLNDTDALQAIDTDGDGVPDYIEVREGSDPTDASSIIDTDGDGIADYIEILAGSDPANPMSLPTDTDSDGVPDVVEEIQGTDQDKVNDFVDSDNDGVSDFEESVRGTDPLDDSDSSQAIDTDRDGVPDYIEIREGSDPTDATSIIDTDGDGVADYIETLAGSDPNDSMSLPVDNDNDGVPDVVEKIQGTNPYDSNSVIDTDGDGVPDFVEIIEGTDPDDRESVLDRNLPPIAVNDSYNFNSNEILLLDVLANDYDPENGEITLISASSDVGVVSIVESSVVLTIPDVTSGTFTVTYVLSDDVSNVSTAFAVVSVTSDFAPIITLPDDLCDESIIKANGLFTRVNLGEASAVDSLGNPLPVSLINPQSHYSPGVHEVFWKASDREGNVSIARQLVCVQPIVSIEKNKTVIEGTTSSVGIYLNGESPVYPVVIPFEVVNGEGKITLISGEVVIESGTQAEVSFDVLSSSESTVFINLLPDINLGDKNSHALTISKDNIAPEVSLTITQNDEQRSTVSRDKSNVIITSSVFDPNLNDTHTYLWSSSDLSIDNISDDEQRFIFDPSVLDEGVYTISLTVIDNNFPEIRDVESIHLNVIDEFSILLEDDSDNDFIPDNIEGHGDSDGDGIADYLDRDDRCNILESEAFLYDSYFIEAQSGVCLKRGRYALSNIAGGAQVTIGDTNIIEEIPSDPDAVNVGGIFDYIAYDLPVRKALLAIVMPQRKPIPSNAVYRKYRQDTGWENFVEDANNMLWSAQGEPGYCPPPSTDINSAAWSPGLSEGHWCVQQIIEDGGPNDDDNVINGVIVDPGGVSTIRTLNNSPIAVNDIISVYVNTARNIDVLDNDTDQNGDLLIITSAYADIGTVSVVDNQLHYISASNYEGEVIVTYGISDGNGGTALGVVTISIIRNESPIANTDNSTINQGESITFNVIGNDTDPENGILNLIDVDNTDVNFQSDGQITFSPAAEFHGNITISYTIRDDIGNVSEGKWFVTVTELIVVEEIKTKGGAFFWPLLFLIGIAVNRQKKLIKVTGIAKVSLIGLLLCSFSSHADNRRCQSTDSVSNYTQCDNHLGWYIGGYLGAVKSKFKQREIDSLFNQLDFEANAIDVDDDDLGFSLLAGYQFNTYWGVESSYINLGERSIDFAGKAADLSYFYDETEHIFPQSGEGLSVALVGSLPLSNDFKLSGKLGYWHWQGKYITSHLSSNVGGDKIHGNDLWVGAEINYRFNDQAQVFFTAEQFDLDGVKNSFLGLGIRYYFNEPTTNTHTRNSIDTTANAVPKLASILSYDDDRDGILNDNDNCTDSNTLYKVDERGCTLLKKQSKHFKLIVNYDHDSSKINKKYEGDLYKLANFINEHQIEQFTVYGHASSIGTKGHNFKLSQDRANSITDFLHKKFSVNKQTIKSVGRGETMLVDTSNTKKAHYLNRRVEIDIEKEIVEPVKK